MLSILAAIGFPILITLIVFAPPREQTAEERIETVRKIFKEVS